MPYFDEKYTLLENSRKPILGICEDFSNENCVLVTINSSVGCYQDLKGSLLKTWITKKDYEITNPCVYSKADNEYLFVLNNNSLATIAAKDFNKFSSFTQKLNIFALLSTGEGDPLIVFEDGSIYTTEYCMSYQDSIEPKNVISAKNERLLNAFIVKISKNDILPCILITDNIDGKHSYLIVKKNSAYTTHELNIHDKILASCVCPLSNNSQCLIAICDNGDVHLIELTIDEDGDFHVACCKIATLDIADSTDVVGLGESNIAVICKQNKIIVLEIHLGEIVATITLNSRIKSIALFSVKEGLAVKTTTALFIYPIANETTNLATIIAEKPDEMVEANIKYDEDDRPIELKDDITEDFTEEEMEDYESSNMDDISLFKTLQTTVSEKNFAESWSKLLSSQNEFERLNLAHSQELKHVLRRFNPDNKKTFWPRKTIIEILITKMIPGRYCGDIICKAVLMADWDLVLKMLNNCQNIPEQYLVNLLNGIFSSEVENVAADKNMSSCVSKIFEQEFTEVCLKPHLCMLPITTVQKLLSYILSRFNSETHLEKNKQSLVDWANVLIDSQTSNLVLTEECWPVMESLKIAVKQQLQIFKELNLIGMYVDQICSKIHFKSNKENTKYFVQVVEI